MTGCLRNPPLGGELDRCPTAPAGTRVDRRAGLPPPAYGRKKSGHVFGWIGEGEGESAHKARERHVVAFYFRILPFHVSGHVFGWSGEGERRRR